MYPIRNLLFFATTIVALAACQRHYDCTIATTEKEAEAHSLSVPETAAVGSDIAITIGIDNPWDGCVRKAGARLQRTGQDSFLVKGLLTYAPTPSDDCPCSSDSVLYALVYFKHMEPGRYYIYLRSSNIYNTTPTGYWIQIQ